ncbi:glutaminyl-peptide cyclotransferase-like isoform X2 [Symsagittifera roscoffensis]
MKERYPNSKGTKEVVQFMKNSLNESGYSVNEQSFTAKDPDGKALHLTNIWAETKRESNNKVVLSCHHDSKIMDAHNSPFIAAIDSAIPCAILMYLAAISGPKGDKKSCAINDKLEKLDISLVFIFFDGEEAIKKWTATDSLYGSRYFAENIDSEVKDFTKNVKLFVLLDLLGSKDPKFNIFHFTHHKCFSKLRGIENDLKSKKSKSCNSNLQYDTSYKRNYFSTNMLSRASGVSDDHEPFLRKVKNILHLIPTPFPTVWHQKTDDEDHLHHPTIENLLQIFTQFIQDLSCAFE